MIDEEIVQEKWIKWSFRLINAKDRINKIIQDFMVF